jgi:hypothetical protein
MHLAVGNVEIVVRPLLEARIVIPVMRVARRLERGVKFGGVLVIGDRRVEIAAAAEPRLAGGEKRVFM